MIVLLTACGVPMLLCIVVVIFLRRQIALVVLALAFLQSDSKFLSCERPGLLRDLTVSKTATKTKAKRCSTKSTKKAAGKCAGASEVTVDRRRESTRRVEVAEVEEEIAAPTLERREKVNRRRQIDPTTCERDYTDTEVEF